jgi:hypothetical protein
MLSALTTMMFPNEEPWLSVLEVFSTADEALPTVRKLPLQRTGPVDVVGRLLVAQDAKPTSARSNTQRGRNDI